MPTKLTNDTVKNAMPEAGKRLELRDHEERGLIFRVTEKGVRTWSVRYRNKAGEQRRKNLGDYPTIGLAKARELARKVKGSVAEGVDVVQVQREEKAAAAKAHTHKFGPLADLYFDKAAKGSHRGGTTLKPKRASTIAEERRIFDNLIRPVLGHRPVAQLTRSELSELIEDVGADAPSNGRHCRNIIRQIMSLAVRMEYRDSNPALGITAAGAKSRDRVLGDAELKSLWTAWQRPQDVEKLFLSPLMGIALRMAMVTLQRGGEVVGMRWDEIDRPAKTWLIPADRMKGKKPHLVPLSALALDLLDEAAAVQEGNGSDFVFPSPRSDDDRPLDRRAFTRAMKRTVDIEALKIKAATPHDLRRTGGTNITSERIGLPRFIVSQVMAHASDTGGAAAVTGKHYDYNDYLPEKRRALDAWASLLSTIVGAAPAASNVIPMRA